MVGHITRVSRVKNITCENRKGEGMKEIVTKVSIKVSDDGGECDLSCPFLISGGTESAGCVAFHKPITNNKRTVGCMDREDVYYQIVGE